MSPFLLTIQTYFSASQSDKSPKVAFILFIFFLITHKLNKSLFGANQALQRSPKGINISKKRYFSHVFRVDVVYKYFCTLFCIIQ